MLWHRQSRTTAVQHSLLSSPPAQMRNMYEGLDSYKTKASEKPITSNINLFYDWLSPHVSSRASVTFFTSWRAVYFKPGCKSHRLCFPSWDKCCNVFYLNPQMKHNSIVHRCELNEEQLPAGWPDVRVSVLCVPAGSLQVSQTLFRSLHWNTVIICLLL